MIQIILLQLYSDGELLFCAGTAEKLSLVTGGVRVIMWVHMH
jgi:hypothetical protein